MSPSRLLNLTIVVVEDHDDTRVYVGKFLVLQGANIALAANGVEGFELVKVKRPDLVLCDLQMPIMDGFELLRKIRALGPEGGGQVPVVAMTAMISHAERARVLDFGFSACLPKPFSAESLIEIILAVTNR